MQTMVAKNIFVRVWFSNFDYQNLTVALFLVSSFINGSVFFIENADPFFLKIFLFTIFRCERLCQIKVKNTSYNQYWRSATNELSSNLNNKFCSNLLQNINFNLKSFFHLYLWIC